MSYDSLLLDHDGVLVDVMDRDRRRRAFRDRAERVFGDNGVTPDEAAVEQLVGSVSYEELLALSDRLGADPEQVWQARDETLAAVLRTAARDGHKRPYPDVDHLADLALPLGIASNNQRRVVESILDEYGLDGYFETVHAREPRPASLREKKPSPTYLERAIEDLGVSNPLYVGDKPTDVEAGRRAGLDVAFLRREHNRDRTLDAEPTYEVTDLERVVSLVE